MQGDLFYLVRLCIRNLAVLFTVLITSSLSAQDIKQKASDSSFDIKQASFLLPQRGTKPRYSYALSLVYIAVPKDWTLDVINVPTFSYEGKYKLPHGFNLQGSFSTLLVSNRINLGPFWNYVRNRYSMGLGYQVAFNFGVLNQFGFKTKMVIWEQQPSLTLGYSFSKTALVLRGDLYWTNSVYEYQGGHTVPHTNSFINGWSTSANFEQRLTKKRLMFVGIKMDYLRYHFIAWPAFPVNHYRYWVPEIHIGFVH